MSKNLGERAREVLASAGAQLEQAAEKLVGDLDRDGVQESAYEEVKGAVVNAVASAKKWFTAKTGYPLQDPTQPVAFKPGEAVQGDETEWVKEQVKAGLLVEAQEPIPSKPAA